MKNLLTSLALASVALITGCSGPGMDPTPAGANLDARSFSATDRNAQLLSLSVPTIGSTTFTVLAGTTVTNDGESVITGDLGVSPGTAITGFQPAPLNAIAGP